LDQRVFSQQGASCAHAPNEFVRLDTCCHELCACYRALPENQVHAGGSGEFPPSAHIRAMQVCRPGRFTSISWKRSCSTTFMRHGSPLAGVFIYRCGGPAMLHIALHRKPSQIRDGDLHSD